MEFRYAHAHLNTGGYKCSIIRPYRPTFFIILFFDYILNIRFKVITKNDRTKM